MKPYPMKDGSLSKQPTTPWGTFVVSCFEAVPGATLEDTEGDLSIAYGYGKLLGQLHKQLSEYPFAGERRDHEALLREAGDRMIRYHAPAYMLRECRNVRNALKGLPIGPENYGIVHYDFEPDNVLFDRNTGTFGVVDFNDAIRCWYALDFARALEAMCDVVGNGLAEEAAERFMEGYRSEKAFTDEQQASLPLMRRLVSVQSYAVILHVLSEEVHNAPDRMTEIIGRLTAVLRKTVAGICSTH